MPFRSVATICGALFAILAVSFFVFPDVVTAAWGMQLQGEAAFIGQRLAASFAGLSVMFWLVRDAGPSVARRALAFGAATALLCVAVVGVLALVRGEAAGGILLSVMVEVVLATALILTGRHTA